MSGFYVNSFISLALNYKSMQELASWILHVYGEAGLCRLVVLSGIRGMQTRCGNLEDSPIPPVSDPSEKPSQICLIPKPVYGIDDLLHVLL